MADKVEFNMESTLRKALSKARGTTGRLPGKASQTDRFNLKMVTALVDKVRASYAQMEDKACSPRRKRELTAFLEKADLVLREYVFGGVPIDAAMKNERISLKPLKATKEPVVAPEPPKK